MLLRRVARPMLAGIFIQGGIAALRDPKTHADMAAPVLDKASPAIDKVTEVAPIEQRPTNEALIQLHAGVEIGAAVLLAWGKAPRLSSAVLAAGLIPTTAANHRFWEYDDPNQRMNHQVHFIKNLGLLGGLMLAAADTEGKPSLAWRARRARRTSAATAELFHKDVTESLGHLGERAGALAEAASKVGTQAGPVSRVAVTRAGERLAPVVTQASTKAGEVASKAGERLVPVVTQASERLAPAVTHAGERLAPVVSHAGERLAPVVSQAGERISGRTGQLISDVEAAGLRALEEARRSKTVKDARKAALKARKRTSKRVDVASRRASKQLEQAQKRAAKRLEKSLDKASKQSSAQLDRAAAKARLVRANVESKLA